MKTEQQTMKDLIESRIEEFGKSPETGYGQPDWREFGFDFASPVRLIASDDQGNKAWADDECVLTSFANGGEHLRYRDGVCRYVRAINFDCGQIAAMDDDALWCAILSGQVAPW